VSVTTVTKPFLVVWIDHALIGDLRFDEVSSDTAEGAAMVVWHRKRGPRGSSYRVSPVDESAPTEIFRFEGDVTRSP
jgi:hypothetical protein